MQGRRITNKAMSYEIVTSASQDHRIGHEATLVECGSAGTLEKIEKYDDGSEMFFVHHPGGIHYADAERYQVDSK